MKKAKNSILACFLCACMLFGLVSPLGTATASAAETVEGKTPVLSNTKYLLSTGQTHMLIATGIQDYDDVYEVGYAIKDMDNVVKTHAVTTKYYTSIAKGNAKWTVEQLFGTDYTGMIVWEVAYDTTKDYSYEAYAKVGNRVDGNLVKSDTVVYGNRRDVVNNPTVTFVAGNNFVEERQVTYNQAYGELPKAPKSDKGDFKGWYLNADGLGRGVTAETLVTTKENHTLYAAYTNKSTYDFSDIGQLDDFVELDHGDKEIVSDATGTYVKFTPTDMNNLYSIFWLNRELKAGTVVEMDFELVGTIATNHGIWTWGANASGGAQFDGQFVTGWDAPTVWNGGKFTSTTNITADCYGVRIQMKYGDNAEAYWKLTEVRITTPIETSGTYDFSDVGQLDDFVELDHGGKEIVSDATGTYAKFTPTDMNNLYSIFWLNKELKAGTVVEMDFELVGTIATNHGIWTWGANASGGAQFDGQFVTGWDAPAVWNGGKFTSTTNITQDCYGVRIQMKYGDNAEAYWKLTEVRIIVPVEYPIAYDFSDTDMLDDFVELDHGGMEIVNDKTGKYAKFTPTDMNNLYSIFWWKQDLKHGMIVEMDFELVGTIATNHGIWTWGANASGGAQFDGQFVTGWDAPAVWNGGKFTSTTNITQDCYGIRIQMKYADNQDAYWKLTSIRILDGSTRPTYKVTTNNHSEETTFDLAFGEKYGSNLPDARSEQAYVEFKGWYMNPNGTGVQITADTAMTIKGDHTIYAVYEEIEEYPRDTDFFEDGQLTNITNVENTKITHVRDASGNYIKLSPMEIGDTTNPNYPQSDFLFKYPYLQEGWVVEMDFELVCNDVNSAQGIYTYEATESGEKLSSEKCFMTSWDAPNDWNNGKFTAVTKISQACQGVRVMVRYANSTSAYWKLTGIRVCTPNEYLDIPFYADDKQIDIGGTSWLGESQTIQWFNGETGEANFKKLQEAGITTLAGTFYANQREEADEIALLDLAAKYGIGLYFQKNWDGTTTPPSYVDHKAFLGYYIDEPTYEELSELESLQEKWNNSAFGQNGKLLYVNLRPIYSSDLGDSYEAYVSKAIESGLQVVSFDHYPMYHKEIRDFWGGTEEHETAITYRTDWLQNFGIAGDYARNNKLPLWYTLLTMQHLTDGVAKKYIDPDVDDLTYQMYMAMTYGATHLTHYTFAGTDDEWGSDILGNAMFNQSTGTWNQTYDDVKDANAKIRQWDHVFMNFNWLGVSAVKGTEVQTGLINNLTNEISVNANNVMQNVTSTQDALVGHFKDANDYYGVMVTNLSKPEEATSTNVTITFSEEYEAVKVYQNGQETLVYLNNGVLTLEVASAEGVFLIPVKAK